MSWILDAMKEPFKNKKKANTKEDKLKELEKMKELIDKMEKELQKDNSPPTVPTVNVPQKEELPELPKFEFEEQPQEIEVTPEKRIEILESNIVNIVNDMHTRITKIESILFRNQ